MEVAPYLPGSEAVLEGNKLSITFDKIFNKNMIGKNRANTTIIKDAVDELYGTDCEISVYSNDTPSSGGDYFEEKIKQAEELGIKLEIE
jgi:hypothetical protein